MYFFNITVIVNIVKLRHRNKKKISPRRLIIKVF